MASDNSEIERLTVTLEADYSRLIKQTKEGVDKAAQELEKVTRKVGDEAEKAGARGKKAGEEMGAGFDKAGAGVGVVAGAVAALTTKLIDLGVAGARALANLVAGGVKLNATIETADRVFDAAFGDPAMGEEVLKFLDEAADKFNIDKNLAREFGQSILPKTDSADSFLELLRLTDIQADATGKSVGELEFAIREALSGDYVSLKDQFDIGKEQVEEIKALTPELGRSAALAKVLGEEFQRLGKVNIQGTLQTDMKAVQAQFTDLQTALGDPVFEEVKEQVGDLGAVLEERKDDFELMAGAVGDVVANVVDLVGSGLTDFLEDLDTDQVIEIANNFLGMVESGRALAEVLGVLELPGDLIDGVETLTSKLNEALTTAVKLTALAKAEIAKRQAEADAIAKTTGLGSNALTQTLAGTGRALLSPFGVEASNEAEVKAAGEKAYREEILKTLEVLDESKKREEAVTEAQKKRRDAQGKETPANTQAIDDFLRQRAAAREAAGSEAANQEAYEKYSLELLDLQKELAGKQEELAQDHAERELEIIQDYSEKVTALEKEIAAEREEIAQETNEALTRLAEETADARADAEADARASLADLERDTQDEINQVREEAQEEERRATEDHQREMQRLQQDYLMNLEDAVTNRDARAIVDLRRKYQQEKQTREEDFQTNRNRSREDTERRIEETREAEDRRREEIQRSLEEELADIAENEAEKREEILASQQEQLADLEQKEAEKRAALEASQQEQLAKEQERYQEAKAALDGAMGERMEAIAKGLAEEEGLEAEHAQKILELLGERYGNEEEALAAFLERKREMLEAQNEWEREMAASSSQATSEPSASTGQGGPTSEAEGGAGIPQFASGGIVPGPRGRRRLILAHAGELVIPPDQTAQWMSQQGQAMAENMTGRQGPIVVELRHSGSAPPGVGDNEVERISAVLVDSLNRAGINARKK